MAKRERCPLSNRCARQAHFRIVRYRIASRRLIGSDAAARAAEVKQVHGTRHPAAGTEAAAAAPDQRRRRHDIVTSRCAEASAAPGRQAPCRALDGHRGGAHRLP